MLAPKEKEGMKDDKGSYKVSMHASTLISVNNFLLYLRHLRWGELRLLKPTMRE